MWDALFADGPSLGLMDYIFVAMLMHIREVCELTALVQEIQKYFLSLTLPFSLSLSLSLSPPSPLCPSAVIEGDYAVCMQHLMHFPPVYEVNYLVQRALHLRNPVSLIITTVEVHVVHMHTQCVPYVAIRVQCACVQTALCNQNFCYNIIK